MLTVSIYMQVPQTYKSGPNCSKFNAVSYKRFVKISNMNITNKLLIFIAPAYSRVRYRSSNIRPSVRSFVRPSVRSSVNIYVEVQFSRHQ